MQKHDHADNTNLENDKFPIKNRRGQTMLVKLETPENGTDNLAILQHGYSGSMDEDHIRAFAKIFLDNGYTVLLMDCTNSFNDADGRLEDNTIQNHYEDLEDVIGWASIQKWYKEPFALGGHSLGGLATLFYAQTYPEKISLLFPAAAVISGALLKEAYKERSLDTYNSFKETGKMLIECSYKENLSAYRPYSWLETMQSWDSLKQANKLSMPVLMIVGSDDDGTPPKHQKLLFDKLPGDKEIYIIEGTDHCYEDKLNEVSQHLDNWLKSYA